MLASLVRTARSWIDIQQTLIDKQMELAAPYARGTLLDVGCGEKPYQKFFTPFIQSYTGVEYEETFAAAAHGQTRAADVTYNGDRLPFEDGSFDTVLCCQVLEHVPQPAPFFADL